MLWRKKKKKCFTNEIMTFKLLPCQSIVTVVACKLACYRTELFASTLNAACRNSLGWIRWQPRERMTCTKSYRYESTDRYRNSCSSRSRIIKRRWWRRNNDTSSEHIFLALRTYRSSRNNLSDRAFFRNVSDRRNYFSRRLFRRRLRSLCCARDPNNLHTNRIGASGLRYLKEYGSLPPFLPHFIAISWRERGRGDSGLPLRRSRRSEYLDRSGPPGEWPSQ